MLVLCRGGLRSDIYLSSIETREDEKATRDRNGASGSRDAMDEEGNYRETETGERAERDRGGIADAGSEDREAKVHCHC